MGGRRACSPPRSGPRPDRWRASWRSSACAMALRLALPVLLGRFADEALGGATTSTLTRLAAAYVAAALGSAALDLVVVWWSARVSWRAGNRLRERLAAHALRLEQAWHGRHSPGQLIERIDGDVEAMAIFFAGMAVQIAGNVALIARHAGRGHGHRRLDRRWCSTVTAVAGAAVMVRLRMAAVDGPRARARGQRPALRRPRGAARRARGPAGQRRRAATPSTACTTTAPGRGGAARYASLRGDGAYAASAIVFAVGTAAHARGRHRPAAAGRHHDRRRPHAVPLRRHAAPAARAHRRAAQGVPEGDGRRPPGLDAARHRARAWPTAPTTAPTCPAGALAVDLDDVTFTLRRPTTPRPRPRCAASTCTSPPAPTSVVVGRTGSGKTTRRTPARPHLGRAARRRAPCASGGVDVRDLDGRRPPRPASPWSPRTSSCSAPSVRDNLTLFGSREATDDELRGRARRGRPRRRGSTPCPTASTRGWPAATACRPARASSLAFARAFLADPVVVVLDEASSRLDPLTERRITRATERLLAGRTAVDHRPPARHARPRRRDRGARAGPASSSTARGLRWPRIRPAATPACARGRAAADDADGRRATALADLAEEVPA